MKCIRIRGCMDDVCPFFKRISHYDYNDELTCIHPEIVGRYNESHRMNDFEDWAFDDTKPMGEPPYKTNPANCGNEGLFPSFCPLESE